MVSPEPLAGEAGLKHYLRAFFTPQRIASTVLIGGIGTIVMIAKQMWTLEISLVESLMMSPLILGLKIVAGFVFPDILGWFIRRLVRDGLKGVRKAMNHFIVHVVLYAIYMTAIMIVGTWIYHPDKLTWSPILWTFGLALLIGEPVTAGIYQIPQIPEHWRRFKHRLPVYLRYARRSLATLRVHLAG
jgi:hypothetical protein